MEWSEQQVEDLSKYWDEGLPVSQIRILLSYKFTRNAIIGKAHRLHLLSRYRPGIVEKARKPKAAKEAKPPPPPKPKRRRVKLTKKDEKALDSVYIILAPLTIVDIPKQFQCKYIYGDVKSGEAHWCRKTTDGGEWCPEHRATVYQPLVYKPRKKKDDEKYY